MPTEASRSEQEIIAPQQHGSHFELERRNRELEQQNATLLAALRETEADLLAHRRTHDEWEWVFEHAVDLLVIRDETGAVVRVSPSVMAILGYSAVEFMRLGVHAIVHPDDIDATIEHLGKIGISSDGLQFVCRCRHRNGEWRWLAWTTPAPRYVDGKISRSFAVGRDITASKLTEQQLLYRAQHDALTGLANRASFDQALDHALARAERNGHQLALLLIDLDGFKAVNDGHGHQAGDAVLAAVAERLRSTQRKVDLVARLGGDEFACLIEDTNEPALDVVAARILDIVQQPVPIGDRDVGVGCSIGIALSRGADCDSRRLFEQADKAMYGVKACGKRGYAYYRDKT